jgi:hypothetical protein
VDLTRHQQKGARHIDHNGFECGLERVTVQAIDILTAFESFDDYWQPFLSDVAPAPGYCVSLSESERDALAAMVRAAVPTDPEGRILMAARAWAVSGLRP